MAPQKKPAAKKAANKAAVKAAVKKPAVVSKAITKPLPKATHAAMHADMKAPPQGKVCCAPGSCCGFVCSCPLFQTVTRREFWAGSVLAFVIIAGTDMALHGGILMDAYRATAQVWRPEGQMQPELFTVVQILTALAYTALVLLMNRTGTWWGGFITGVAASAPVAINALTAYITLPLESGYIPGMWAAGSLVQGGLVGLAVAAVTRLMNKGSCCAK